MTPWPPSVEILHVVGLELLHLHAADIGDDQILDGGKVGFVGFGCPFVFAALLGQPIYEELCYRHRGRNQESTSRQFMLDLLFSVCCLLFCGKTLPFAAALAVLIYHFQMVSYGFRNPPQSNRITVIW